MAWDQQELFAGILAEFAECPGRAAVIDGEVEAWRRHVARRNASVRAASASAYARLKLDPVRLRARNARVHARAILREAGCSEADVFGMATTPAAIRARRRLFAMYAARGLRTAQIAGLFGCSETSVREGVKAWRLQRVTRRVARVGEALAATRENLRWLRVAHISRSQRPADLRPSDARLSDSEARPTRLQISSNGNTAEVLP